MAQVHQAGELNSRHAEMNHARAGRGKGISVTVYHEANSPHPPMPFGAGKRLKLYHEVINP
jgi:hypothetical protein